MSVEERSGGEVKLDLSAQAAELGLVGTFLLQRVVVASAALEERQTATASAAESLAACEREAERLEGVRERLEAMRGALWVGEGRER